MICPYCLKTIEDGALACQFCKRDLNFFTPISKQITEIERRLATAESKINEPLQRSEWVLGLPEIAPMVAVSSSVFLAASFTWIGWRPFVGNGRFVNTLLQILSIASPFFAAFGLGALRRVRTSAYLVLGLTAGFFGFGQMLLVYADSKVDSALRFSSSFTCPSGTYVFAVPHRWYWSLFIYPLTGAVLFVSAGRLADWLQPDRERASNQQRIGLEKWLAILSPFFVPVFGLIQALLTRHVNR